MCGNYFLLLHTEVSAVPTEISEIMFLERAVSPLPEGLSSTAL